MGMGIVHSTGNFLSVIELAHYMLVFFGWIGLVVLGSELQFYRAISGIRKFEKELHRKLFVISLFLGVILVTIGPFISYPLILTGLIFYFVGILLHFRWLIIIRLRKLYKFPLNYFLSAQIFHLTGVLFLFFYFLGVKAFSFRSITHIFTIGWISLVLQGALIRALPMFIGFGIHPKFKPYLNIHHLFSVLSSILLLSGFFLEDMLFYSIGGILWILSWVFVLIVLAASFKPRPGRKFIHGVTLGFMLPGLFWSAIGAILGMMSISGISFDFEVKPVHVHLTLVAGISLLMLGALHRITTFQIFTLLYTGKRKDVEVTESSLLNDELIKKFIVFLNSSTLLLVWGFISSESWIILSGGALIFLSSLGIGWVIIKNLLLYLKEKDKALPFYLKKGEAK